MNEKPTTKNMPSGTFVLCGAVTIEGGLTQPGDFNVDKSLPTLVFVMPMGKDINANIQFVFSDGHSLHKFKQAIVSMDMASLFPTELVVAGVSAAGIEIEPEAKRH